MEKSKQYAALQALNAVLAEYGHTINQEQYKVELSSEMLKQSRYSHKDAATSTRTSRKWLEGKLDTKWEEIAGSVQQKLRIEESAFQNVRNKLNEKFLRTKGTILDAQVNVQDGTIFKEARKSALVKQLELLNHNSYPPVDVVNQINRREKWTNEEVETIKNNVEAGRALFDENQNEVTGIVKSIRDDIDSQRQGQLNAVNVAPPSEIVTTDSAADFLRTKLDDELARERKSEIERQSGRKVYERLEKTDIHIQEVSEKIEKQRFGNFLEQRFTPEIDSNSLKAAIRRDLSRHKIIDSSTRMFGEKMQEETGKRAVDQYTQQNRTVSDIDGFRSRLSQYLKQGSARGSLWNKLIDTLAPELKKHRNEIAEEQFNDNFRPLASQVWKTPEDVLERIDEGTLAISDLSTFQQTEELLGIKSGNAEPGELLSETESRVHHAAVKAVNEGKKAWDTQEALVKNKRGAIESQLTAAQRANRLGAERDWVKKYTTEVAAAWKNDPLAARYPKLFDKMIQTIKDKVHSFYKTEIPEPVVNETGPKGPPGTGGGDNGGNNGNNPNSVDEESSECKKKADALHKEISDLTHEIGTLQKRISELEAGNSDYQGR
ncbi:MAG: hypothetical protein ACRESZ_07730 [Methylococcales bacterium]